MTNDRVRINATYAWGAPCLAELPRASLRGLTAETVISRVSEEPQATEPARRTARVLREAMGSGRRLYIERAVNRPIDDEQPGEPLRADDVAVPVADSPQATAEEVSFRVSESYVGG